MRLVWSLLIALTLGCSGTPDAPTTPSDKTSPSSPAQPSAETTPHQADSELHAEGTAVVDRAINQRYDDNANAAQWAQRFEREGREVYDRKTQIMAGLSLKPGLKVADIGAGSGLFTVDLAKAVGETGRVYAVDVQAYFLDHIQQRAEKANVSNISVVRATHRSVGLPDASIDLAFLCDVFHHVEHPKTYLASLLRAVRPGGRVIVIDFRAVEGKSKQWVLKHVRTDPATFRREFETAGFEFVREIPGLEENFFFEFRKPAG